MPSEQRGTRAGALRSTRLTKTSWPPSMSAIFPVIRRIAQPNASAATVITQSAIPAFVGRRVAKCGVKLVEGGLQHAGNRDRDRDQPAVCAHKWKWDLN